MVLPPGARVGGTHIKPRLQRIPQRQFWGTRAQPQVLVDSGHSRAIEVAGPAPGM